MDWLKEGTTWDVVQEWRRRYPMFSDLRVTTPDMRAVLAGEKIIARYKRGFIITTQSELDKRNALIRAANAKIREANRRAKAEFLNSPVGKDLVTTLASITALIGKSKK